MKRIVTLLVLCIMLNGCSTGTKEMDKALSARQKLLRAESCNFDAEVTVDYPDKTFTFLLRCICDADGNVSFTVLQPESIAGIAGSISEEGGKFSFEDTVLAFESLANETVSPIIAPWLVLRSLRGGYISRCAEGQKGICIEIDDTYYGNNLHTEILMREDGVPESGDIYYNGSRIVTVIVSNFKIV